MKDSRVSEQDNSVFLDLLEDYFAQPDEQLRKDIRPEFGYQGKLHLEELDGAIVCPLKPCGVATSTPSACQSNTDTVHLLFARCLFDANATVGATLENTEKPRCSLDTECHELIASLDASERPLDLTGEFKDPKCRFFWRMNKHELDNLPEEAQLPKEETDAESKFAILKAPNVLPAAFPDWKEKMEKWGNQMLTAVDDVNGMLAVGLGLPEDSLKKLARYTLPSLDRVSFISLTIPSLSETVPTCSHLPLRT